MSSYISTQSRLVLLSPRLTFSPMFLCASVNTVLWNHLERKQRLPHTVLTLNDKWCFTDAVQLFNCVSVCVSPSFITLSKHFISTLIFFCVGITVLISQGYFYNDDTFNFNYAQAKAALGNYKEAEEVNCFFRNSIYTFFNADWSIIINNIIILHWFEIFPSGFSVDSEWKDQKWLCLPQLAGAMLYVF